MKNIVVIGGGSGVAAILRGLKNLDEIYLTAIITVADDGGSTGRLRNKYNIPAVGDIRNVLVALAESESLLKRLMNYRFYGDSDAGEDVEGHSLGNIILTALTQSSGSFLEAIKKLEKVLRIKGSIIPASIDVVDLGAKMDDGSIVYGETNIRNSKKAISEVFYKDVVSCTQEAMAAISEADYILLGIGSLYTSIIPNLIMGGIKESIKNSNKELIYLSNIMSEVGETDNYDVSDHIRALEKHLERQIDTIIYPNNQIPAAVLAAYQKENASLVKLDRDKLDGNYNIFEADLLTFEHNQAKHDSNKICQFFKEKLIKDSMKE